MTSAEYMKAYRVTNAERLRAANAAWRACNPEKVKAQRDRYRARRKAADPDWMKDYLKEYSAANHQAHMARNTRWRAANRERAREHALAYVRRYPHKAVEGCARRYAAKTNATPKWLTREQLVEIQSWYALARQTGQHVDHIVPLRGKMVSGLHVPWNLQLLAREDNIRKGNHYG